jgi:hypothetical protein
MKTATWLLCCLLAQQAFAEDLARGPAPAWVNVADWQPPPASKTTGADYEDYLRDYQVNLTTQEEYVHYAFRYLTGKGVQNDSTFSIDYAPDYQTARLHKLVLWRDGQAIDELGIAFRNVQRESGLEEAMYDGEHTWVGFLKDVRPGDVLEVAYSIQGNNPIFAGRYADTYHVETSYAVNHWSLRLLAPEGHSPEVRGLNTSIKPVVTKWNGLDETTMSSDNVNAVSTDNLAPSDIDQRGRYVVSDWKTWGDVASWALPMYTAQESPEVTAKATELVQGLKTPDEKLVALLQFVQDKVRYMGIEVGVNSHQPRPAAEVLGNGFGDCKDKVMLFCSLASAAGLQAWPVLVHTRSGMLINDEGPTPLAFNHVIAAVVSSVGVRYVDATADQQGGPLTERSVGSFVYGLELKPGTTDLTKLPEGSSGRRELVQTYRFKSFDQDATVLMEYTFAGTDADYQRRRWEGLAVADWRKDTEQWLHEHYGDAHVAGDPTIFDDRQDNVFQLTYKFTLKHHWKKDGKGYQAEFYPQLVGANLYDPDRVAARDQPYALEHPETVKQVRRIEVPENWSIDPEDKTVNGPGFQLTTKAKQVTPRLIEMVDEYRSTSDRVQPAQWDEYLKALRTGRDNMDWTLTWQPSEPKVTPAAAVTPAPAAPPKADNDAMLPIGSAVMGVILFLLIAASHGADF